MYSFLRLLTNTSPIFLPGIASVITPCYARQIPPHGTSGQIQPTFLPASLSCLGYKPLPRAECVAFLKCQVHFTRHVFGVFNEIAVVVIESCLMTGVFLPLPLRVSPVSYSMRFLRSHRLHQWHGRLLFVHTLANNNDVGGYPVPLKVLLLHTESTHEICSSLALIQSRSFLLLSSVPLDVIKIPKPPSRSLHIFAIQKSLYVVEFLRQVFVACGVVHTESGNERNIGNS